MATMKLYELVNHYHIGTELTCAEAVFMACNEYYHLNLSEETRKMFSVMGSTVSSCKSWRSWGVRIPATPLWRRWPKSWRSCWRAAGSSAR